MLSVNLYSLEFSVKLSGRCSKRDAPKKLWVPVSKSNLIKSSGDWIALSIVAVCELAVWCPWPQIDVPGGELGVVFNFHLYKYSFTRWVCSFFLLEVYVVLVILSWQLCRNEHLLCHGLITTLPELVKWTYTSSTPMEGHNRIYWVWLIYVQYLSSFVKCIFFPHWKSLISFPLWPCYFLQLTWRLPSIHCMMYDVELLCDIMWNKQISVTDKNISFVLPL